MQTMYEAQQLIFYCYNIRSLSPTDSMYVAILCAQKQEVGYGK